MGGMTFTPDFTQFRFYNDDGTDATSTAIAAQNTNVNVDVSAGDVIVQLRGGVQETGGASGATTDDFRWEVRKNGGGSWAMDRDWETGTV